MIFNQLKEFILLEDLKVIIRGNDIDILIDEEIHHFSMKDFYTQSQKK